MPQRNGIGSVGCAYAASEGIIDGEPHFWISANLQRAIRFRTIEDAEQFNDKYIRVGELSKPMDIIQI